MKLLIIISALLSLNSALAAEKIQKSYRPYTGLITMDDDQTEARVMGIGLDGKYTYKLFDGVVFNVKAGVLLESGSNNSLNLKEYEPEQQIYLDEGTLDLDLSFFELKAGAIGLSYIDSPLLVGNTIFLGVREKVSFGQDIKIFISSQQSIPYNQALNRRSGGIEEGTPTFLYHEAGFSFSNSNTHFDLTGGFYKFNNLSSEVANKSRFMGNSVTGTGSISRFVYDFEGTNISTNMEFGKENIVGLKIYGQYLFNDKAPDSSNSGHLLRSLLVYEDYEIGGEIYENGANTSPGYYNSKQYGHNARKGQSAIFNINRIKKVWKLETRFAVMNSTEISNLLVSDGQLFTLKFSRSYGEF